VKVALECLEVINGLHGANFGIYGSIPMEVKEQARERRMTSFVHERREMNGEAHRMARFASSLLGGRHVWFLEPPAVLNMPVTLNLHE
jgi:hypothetical protein